MTDTTDKYIFDEGDVLITHEKSYATGVPAMLVSLRAEDRNSATVPDQVFMDRHRGLRGVREASAVG